MESIGSGLTELFHFAVGARDSLGQRPGADIPHRVRLDMEIFVSGSCAGIRKNKRKIARPGPCRRSAQEIPPHGAPVAINNMMH